MENNNKLDVENLAHYYFEWKLPISEIANLYSTPPYKIHYILKKSFPDIKYRKVKNRMLKQKLTKEELIELHYNKKMPLLEIAKIFGVTYSAVHDYMKKLNMPTAKNKITKEKPKGYKIEKINLPKEKLYELYYGQKLSLQKIGKLYGKPREYIHRWMRIYGFKSRTKSEAWEQRGKYKINEKFFDNWSEEMAYVLGLILTDGNIGADGNRISLTMKEGDHLEKIKNILKSEHPVKYNKIANMYYFGFSRKKMANSLFKLGITRNKSLTVKFPDVPDKFLSHFIRGVFDGDGSVFFEPRSNKSPLGVSFTSGSGKFIKALESKLHSHAGLRKRTIYELHRGRISYYIRYRHKECLKFFDYAYAGVDESMRLERKYQKFLEGMRSGSVT